ncbi:MAG: hypothetical protein GY863_02710, partial [bacterium]|nr:hypothetical protein [bacterium]
MRFYRKGLFLLMLITILFGCTVQQGGINTGIPTPSEFIGFAMGTDRTLADPEQIYGYMEKLSEISGRIVFKEVGRTTDDNPYAMVYVSSEDNIRKLDHYKAINDQLA